jgi:hypothetical protein
LYQLSTDLRDFDFRPARQPGFKTRTQGLNIVGLNADEIGLECVAQTLLRWSQKV